MGTIKKWVPLSSIDRTTPFTAVGLKKSYVWTDNNASLFFADVPDSPFTFDKMSSIWSYNTAEGGYPGCYRINRKSNTTLYVFCRSTSNSTGVDITQYYSVRNAELNALFEEEIGEEGITYDYTRLATRPNQYDNVYYCCHNPNNTELYDNLYVYAEVEEPQTEDKIFLGELPIKDVKFGNLQVKSVFFGVNVVWNKDE